MPQAVDSLATVVEQLTERLRDLERRVAGLESRPEVRPSLQPAAPLAQPCPAARTTFPSIETSASIFPTLGKAALGFAGAFLLRAINQASAVPTLPVLTVAIAYSFLWMMWAIHPNWPRNYSHFSKTAKPDIFGSLTYALTSALILCPLLWESTIRFQVLSPRMASFVLVAFVVITLALSARRQLQLIPWVVTISAVITAFALIIGTRDLVPLVTALLALSLATEVTVVLGHPLTFRAIPAVVSDFGVWLLISVLNAEPIPEGYRAAPHSTIILLTSLLPAIYGVTIAIRGFARRQRITHFEIAQAAFSVALAAYGIDRVTKGHAAPVLGTVFLVLAMIFYWGTLLRFAAEPYARNRRICAYVAAVLFLCGSLLLLPVNWEQIFLCFAALLTTIFYARTLKLSLGLHTSFYIAASVVISALPTYVANALAGIVPEAPRWPEFTIALTASLCYAIGANGRSDQVRRRMLWIIPAFVSAASLAAIFVSVIVRMGLGFNALSASRLSVIRTVVICILALALGSSSGKPRIELEWIAYAAVALGTLKLVFEDLRFGNAASLVISFVFYGLVLILLPRLTRRTRTVE